MLVIWTHKTPSFIFNWKNIVPFLNNHLTMYSYTIKAGTGTVNLEANLWLHLTCNIFNFKTSINYALIKIINFRTPIFFMFLDIVYGGGLNWQGIREQSWQPLELHCWLGRKISSSVNLWPLDAARQLWLVVTLLKCL